MFFKKKKHTHTHTSTYMVDSCRSLIMLHAMNDMKSLFAFVFKCACKSGASPSVRTATGSSFLRIVSPFKDVDIRCDNHTNPKYSTVCCKCRVLFLSQHIVRVTVKED